MLPSPRLSALLRKAPPDRACAAHIQSRVLRGLDGISTQIDGLREFPSTTREWNVIRRRPNKIMSIRCPLPNRVRKVRYKETAAAISKWPALRSPTGALTQSFANDLRENSLSVVEGFLTDPTSNRDSHA